MTFYATIDTNVLLSGVLKPKSGLGTLVLECIFGKIIRKKYGYYYFPDETDIKFFTQRYMTNLKRRHYL